MEFLYSKGDRAAPADRTFTNWPLPRVRMDLKIDGTRDLIPGATYPIRFMADRQHRINVYENLYIGNPAHFVHDAASARILINYFRRLIKVLMAKMTRTGPTLGDMSLTGAAIDFGTEINKTGKGFLIRMEGQPVCPQTYDCFPDVDGSLHVVCVDKMVDSSQMINDVLQVTTIYPDGGGWEAWRSPINGGQISEIMDFIDGPDGEWTSVDRPQSRDGWGESLFDDLIPPVIGMALRLTGAEYVMVGNEAPVHVIPGADFDLSRAIVGDESQSAELQNISRIEIQENLAKMFDKRYVMGPPTLDKAYTLEWDGNLHNLDTLYQIFHAELRMLTSLVHALDSESGDVPSGTALAQMDTLIRDTTREEHAMMAEAFEMLWPGVMWPPPFEAPEIGPDEPEEPTDQEMMEEEADE